jgi:hypothetical protein
MDPDYSKNRKTFMVTKKGEKLAASLLINRFVAIEDANHYSIILSKYSQLVSEVKDFLASTEKSNGNLSIC